MNYRKLFLITNANKVRVGYTFAFLMLLLSLGLTLQSANKLVLRADKVDKTNALILNLETYLGSMKDVETGFRGYLLTRNTEFLAPYKDGIHKMDSLLLNIANLKKGNTYRDDYTPILMQLKDQRTNMLSSGLEMMDRDGSIQKDSLQFMLYNGKITMDSIRNVVNNMETAERLRLLEYTSNVDALTTSIRTINITSLLVSVILAFYSFLTFNKENRERLLADGKAADYRKRLEERVMELRTANAELVQLRTSEKFAATGRIARTIAHEVRNPLTNVNLAVEQLREDIAAESEEPHMLLNMITRNSSRINQLVTELLDSTRFSELKYEVKSINTLLDEALLMAMDRIHLKKITVIKKYQAEVCDVKVDSERIKIAFLNIIVNALEAMEAGVGILTLQTAVINKKCTISITDNGIGMNDDALQKMFEPYFTNKKNGNGLGMTNTQNIILNHNGSINVESVVGSGTTFTIDLLLLQE